MPTWLIVVSVILCIVVLVLPILIPRKSVEAEVQSWVDKDLEALKSDDLSDEERKELEERVERGYELLAMPSVRGH